MRYLLLITALFAATAHAEVGPRFKGEKPSDADMLEWCGGAAQLTAKLYELRNMLPADLEQERAMEVMERLVASGKLAEVADKAPDEVPEEEREYVREMFSDPEFLEGWLYATEYVWMHPHQEDYGMTDEEKAQDLIEFEEDVLFNCVRDVKAMMQ